MTDRPEAEQPFHFGPGQTLFGLYRPATGTLRGAVLLCPPLGQEQLRSHRLYRQLAGTLAGEGFAVLRFDCHGSGDSAGDSDAVEWRRCVEDTVCAANELRARSGCTTVIAFGARLGGSLALAAAGEARIARLVVWDAVLDGAAHVAGLDAWQERLRQDGSRFSKPRSREDAANQWLGFPISPVLRRQLSGLQPEPPGVPIVLLQSESTALTPRHEHFIAAGATRAVLAVPAPWEDDSRLEAAILSHELIKCVRSHLREGS
jgi:pimeloyl-ACP methyl ester carboxylesterase